MRRALWCFAALSFALSTAAVTAQVTSFPYEAVVETDGVPIHSGPGFYATNRLKKGTHVVVQRHDPGGWSMIAPPPGEFSLVKSSAIREIGGGSAEVVVAEASARVGSHVGKDFGVEQIPLTEGDRVTLKAGVAAPSGWTAIEPPRGEYRWISGRFIVPVSPSARVEQDADPYAVPSLAQRPETFDESYAEFEPLKRAEAAEGPSLLAVKTESLPSSKIEPGDLMRNLDRELEGLTLSEPTEWPLDKLASGYTQLKDQSPSLSRQIDVRLAQIDKMRLVKTNYSEYVQLTSATDDRDALLLARHETAKPIAGAGMMNPSFAAAPHRFAAPPNVSPIPMAPPAEPANVASGPHLLAPEISRSAAPAPPQRMQLAAPAHPTLPPNAQITQQPMRPAAQSQAAQSQAAQLQAAQSQPAQPQAARPQAALSADQPRRFDAVGIVRKAIDPQPAGPKYVLVAPNGRILVYLQEPKNVSFEGFVGQPMGVDGQPQPHPQLKTPMLAVERLTPVRL